jgi:hypothetical protein
MPSRTSFRKISTSSVASLDQPARAWKFTRGRKGEKRPLYLRGHGTELGFRRSLCLVGRKKMRGGTLVLLGGDGGGDERC